MCMLKVVGIKSSHAFFLTCINLQHFNSYKYVRAKILHMLTSWWIEVCQVPPSEGLAVKLFTALSLNTASEVYGIGVELLIAARTDVKTPECRVFPAVFAAKNFTFVCSNFAEV